MHDEDEEDSEQESDHESASRFCKRWRDHWSRERDGSMQARIELCRTTTRAGTLGAIMLQRNTAVDHLTRLIEALALDKEAAKMNTLSAATSAWFFLQGLQTNPFWIPKK